MEKTYQYSAKSLVTCTWCNIYVCKHSNNFARLKQVARLTWWRHQMEKFSALLAISVGNSPVPGELPTQRPVTRGFDVFFDLRPNKRLSKQTWGWWFETLSCSLWRHCNVSNKHPLLGLSHHIVTKFHINTMSRNVTTGGLDNVVNHCECYLSVSSPLTSTSPPIPSPQHDLFPGCHVFFP